MRVSVCMRERGQAWSGFDKSGRLCLALGDGTRKSLYGSWMVTMRNAIILNKEYGPHTATERERKKAKQVLEIDRRLER